jgi:hypothetical protein
LVASQTATNSTSARPRPNSARRLATTQLAEAEDGTWRQAADVAALEHWMSSWDLPDSSPSPRICRWVGDQRRDPSMAAECEMLRECLNWIGLNRIITLM